MNNWVKKVWHYFQFSIEKFVNDGVNDFAVKIFQLDDAIKIVAIYL